MASPNVKVRERSRLLNLFNGLRLPQLPGVVAAERRAEGQRL